ncbi:MAG: methyltransferase [Flavobacteriales bacterium]|nr:methyltransferase [Flavobacteriales bacterium]
MPKAEFRFKQFTVRQERCSMKVSTDGVLFGAWVDYAGATRILDIGTGTGLLALISAQRNAQARIDALEIDDDAAAQAAENMAASPWADRVRVHRADARRVHAGDPYDLILCNPPYYSGYSTSPDARIGLAKHSGELTFPQLIAAVEKRGARWSAGGDHSREPGGTIPSGGRAHRACSITALPCALRVAPAA